MRVREIRDYQEFKDFREELWKDLAIYGGTEHIALQIPKELAEKLLSDIMGSYLNREEAIPKNITSLYLKEVDKTLNFIIV